MRVRITIPDKLYDLAKEYAIDQTRSIQNLIIHSLKIELKRRGISNNSKKES